SAEHRMFRGAQTPRSGDIVRFRGPSSGALCFWRKREGVEPTKGRLAAFPRFEVWTSHRGRFSPRIGCSRLAAPAAKQAELLLVHAPQIAASERDAVAVEKFQD